VLLHNKKEIYSPLQNGTAAEYIVMHSCTRCFTALLPKISIPNNYCVSYVSAVSFVYNHWQSFGGNGGKTGTMYCVVFRW